MAYAALITPRFDTRSQFVAASAIRAARIGFAWHLSPPLSTLDNRPSNSEQHRMSNSGIVMRSGTTEVEDIH